MTVQDAAVRRQVEGLGESVRFCEALSSGTLRGDDLRFVLDRMPRVARALANGLGVSIGELRTLGTEGKLTTERVISALACAAPEPVQ